MSIQKLRTAVVGFGFMGRTHALHILQSEIMQLVAIVDQRVDCLDQAIGGNLQTGTLDRAALDEVTVYTDLDECIAKESLDLLFLSVPTPAHYSLAMKALHAGIHVFIEKPFVLDLSEGEQLIREAARLHRKIGIAHVVRFMPAYLYLRRLYQSSQLGALKFISMSRVSGLPDWGDWAAHRAAFGSSGGALFDLNIHDIDFLRDLLGVPDEVDATVLPGLLSRQDYFSASWSYHQQEVKVRVEGGNIFHSKFPFRAEYVALFEQGTVSWSSTDEWNVSIASDETVETILLDQQIDGYRDEGDYFARAILDDFIPERCSAESALESIKLCYRHLNK